MKQVKPEALISRMHRFFFQASTNKAPWTDKDNECVSVPPPGQTKQEEVMDRMICMITQTPHPPSPHLQTLIVYANMNNNIQLTLRQAAER